MKIFLKKLLTACTVCFVLFSYTVLPAQDTLQTEKVIAKIKLKNGSFKAGQITRAGKDSVILIDQNNEVQTIAFNDISEVSYLNKRQLRKLWWYENPNKLGYLFAPTSFRLDPGEFYYKNTYLTFNSLHIGITNRFSAGVMAEVFGRSFFSAHVKMNLIEHKNFKFNSGLTYMYLRGSSIETVSGRSINNIGFVYGAGTWGDYNKNITLGAGYLFLETGTALPVSFLMAANFRLSKRFALVTDNWLLFAGTKFPYFFSYGVRVLSQSSTIDFAFINNNEFSLVTPIGIPYISYTLKISNY